MKIDKTKLKQWIENEREQQENRYVSSETEYKKGVLSTLTKLEEYITTDRKLEIREDYMSYTNMAGDTIRIGLTQFDGIRIRVSLDKNRGMAIRLNTAKQLAEHIIRWVEEYEHLLPKKGEE